jgi:50S ribosomal protein L16 3-hydroxylase
MALTASGNLTVGRRFWERHLRAHPLSRPSVARDVFPAPFTTPEEVFQGIVLAAEDARAGRPHELRLYVGDPKMVYRQNDESLGKAYWELLPRAEDGSLGAYGERLRARHGYTCFALMLNNCQTVMPGLWFRLRDFYSGLFEHTGFIRGGTDCNLFAGNYRATPFGAHLDDQDVFTVIVEGRKKVLAWAPKVFRQMQARLGADSHDYAGHRERATVLEGTVGDLLYWPREYGHVAEAAEEGLVTTLSLGVNRGSTAAPWVEAAVSKVIREALPGDAEAERSRFRESDRAGAARSLPRDFVTAMKASRSPKAAPRIEAELRMRWLAWVTGLGLKTPPEAATTKVSDRDTVRADSGHPIQCVTWRGETFAAANGFVVALPYAKGHAAMVRELNRGRPLAVKALLERFKAGPERELARLLLRRLMAFRALVRVAAEP